MRLPTGWRLSERPVLVSLGYLHDQVRRCARISCSKNQVTPSSNEFATSRLHPGNMPGINSIVVAAQRRPELVRRGSGRKQHILDSPTAQYPAEMPLTLAASPSPTLFVESRVNIL